MSSNQSPSTIQKLKLLENELKNVKQNPTQPKEEQLEILEQKNQLMSHQISSVIDECNNRSQTGRMFDIAGFEVLQG